MASAMIHASKHAYRIFVMPYNGQCLYGTKVCGLDAMGKENLITPCINGTDHNTSVSMGNKRNCVS